MRKINRSAPLAEFSALVSGNSCPTNWDEFTKAYHELYRQVRNQLLADQENMSGYTEIPLESSGNIHIDHYMKKGMFPSLMFAWNNFIVDEKNNPHYGAGFKDDHVHQPDYAKIINPVIEQPSEYLTYVEDGTIIARRDLIDEAMRDKAEFTIYIFNLNHPSLKKSRGDILSAIRACQNGKMEKVDVEDALALCGFKSLIDFAYQE